MKQIALLVLALAVTCSALDRQPNADYRARRQRLAAKTEGGVVLLFAGLEPSGPNATHGFRQDENFFYLTGWSEPGPALLVAAEVPATETTPGRPYIEILFLPQRNATQEKWTGPKLGPDDKRAAQITGFDRVETLDRLHDELVLILPSPRATIYTDIPSGDETSWSTAALEWLKRGNAFPNYASFIDVKAIMATLRMTKDAGEIERIRHATQASIAAHLAAMRAMKPGINEHDISALMQSEFMKRGCEGPAYAPIVGSGPFSTVLHYAQDSRQIEAGDLVVMDVGGEYAMYATDITRTLPATGKFTARQREIYDIVLGAQRAAMNAFQAGTSALSGTRPESLYRVALDYINAHGKDSHGQPLGQYFIHGLGHPVGLNVHDPSYTGTLGPGMVFTLEPGIYIPEEKLGVRIEDIFYVDAEGRLVDLTADLPHTAEEVEHAMSVK